MAEIDPIKVGVMWQKLETMEQEVSELRADVKTLLEMANKSKGGLWAGMMIVSAISSFIGYFSHYFSIK
jgi:hypothetical protein